MNVGPKTECPIECFVEDFECFVKDFGQRPNVRYSLALTTNREKLIFQIEEHQPHYTWSVYNPSDIMAFFLTQFFLNNGIDPKHNTLVLIGRYPDETWIPHFFTKYQGSTVELYVDEFTCFYMSKDLPKITKFKRFAGVTLVSQISQLFPFDLLPGLRQFERTNIFLPTQNICKT